MTFRETYDRASQKVQSVSSNEKDRSRDRRSPINITEVTHVLASVPDMKNELCHTLLSLV